MLKSFEQSKPSASEGAAVAWIAAQLERQQNALSHSRRLPAFPSGARCPRALSCRAAALAAVLILGVSLYNRDSDGPGKLNSGIGSGQFRSGAIHL